MLSCASAPMPLRVHARAQPPLQVLHPLHRPPHAHRSPQLLGLRAAETRHRHRHAQQLLLKQRHAQRPLQHRFQRRMRIRHLLLALPPPHVRMHHLTHNRPRPDDRHLHHQVVKPHRRVVRQRRHLCAALHLEHAHRVGPAQRLIHHWILRQQRQIHLLAVVPRDQFDRFLQRRHHPQPQQIHLDQTHVRAVFLVPLDHRAPRHRGALDRHHAIQHARANHHAARVLPQMPRQILHAQAQSRDNAQSADAERRTQPAQNVFPSCRSRRATPSGPSVPTAAPTAPPRIPALCPPRAPPTARDT
jgi:hypothetical protein